jgi:hypothetical protein
MKMDYAERDIYHTQSEMIAFVNDFALKMVKITAVFCFSTVFAKLFRISCVKSQYRIAEFCTYLFEY